MYHFLIGGTGVARAVAREVLDEWTKASAEGGSATDFTFEILEGEATWGGSMAGSEHVISVTATYNASRFSDPARVKTDALELHKRLKERTGNAAIPLTTTERTFVTW